jgi:cyd operon protein YbgT
MWYFTWILGVGLALAFGIINVMWLEASYALGDLTEEYTTQRFRDRSE